MDKMYFAATEGFINGVYRKVGDPIGRLNELQAKYLVMAGQVTEEKPAELAGKRTPEPKPKADPKPVAPETKVDD